MKNMGVFYYSFDIDNMKQMADNFAKVYSELYTIFQATNLCIKTSHLIAYKSTSFLLSKC